MDLFIIQVELVFITFFRIGMAILYGNVIVGMVVGVVVGGVMVIDLLMVQFVKVIGFN